METPSSHEVCYAGRRDARWTVPKRQSSTVLGKPLERMRISEVVRMLVDRVDSFALIYPEDLVNSFGSLTLFNAILTVTVTLPKSKPSAAVPESFLILRIPHRE
jgi:hypothetical protein